MALNFGDILEAVAAKRGDQLAISSDEGDLSWHAFNQRTNALARSLADLGVSPGDKVCFFLFNGRPYLELISACFKGRFVHVNANYRYTATELSYVLDNSDSVALVYDSKLSDIVKALPAEQRDKVLLIETGSGDTADSAHDYEDLIENSGGDTLDIERSPEDLLFIYTGGTTGMPKGVMWTHHEQIHALLGSVLIGQQGTLSLDKIVSSLDEPTAYMRPLIASPLMHGLGLVTALTTLCNGGHIIVTDNSGAFDAIHHWQLAERHKADAVAIVGDTFAKPLLAALDEGEYDLSHVTVIGSSGVMWSLPVKQALLKHLPQATMFDSLASTEAMGLGASVTTADGVAETAKFMIGDGCAVFDEDWNPVDPGSGESGLLARSGPLPLGYYKDQKKTDETFKTIGGKRYSIPGDMCTVDADGTINLLGRGSQCINTGGEKVFPEEVEQALIAHPQIEDALVVGVSDPKWGQAVQAVVRLSGERDTSEADMREFLRTQLAGYKVPKKIAVSQSDLRLANGKPNYKAARSLLDAAST